ncbi:MAG: OmpA family protein [Bdellovibrio sp.]|nr:OmpA family protein [Bdellovibrio sp.]
MKTVFLIPVAMYWVVLAAIGAENPDEKLLTPYPGTEVITNEVKDFDELDIPLAPKTNGKIAVQQKVQGRWTRLEYSFPQGRSALEVYKNYSDALTKGGFKIIFSCRKEECGFDGGPVKGLGYWPYDTSHYLVAQLSRKGERVWVVLDVRTNSSIYVNVLREKAMETDLVVVNAAVLEKSIADEGHVAVYGIEFDTGNAELKPTSSPIITEIAKLLNADPKLKIYIVGHTDNVGGLEQNLDLARKRAASVCKVLITHHKIGADRLSPQGVGPLVPLATNGTHEGRARNRRVDLVKQ